RPPNTVGKSAARIANGPISTKVGTTAKGSDAGPPFAAGGSFGLSSGLISGPRPGGSFSSAGGGAFLPESPSVTTCFNSSVVPLNVRRRYGSQWVNSQVTSSGLSPWPIIWNQVPLV